VDAVSSSAVRRGLHYAALITPPSNHEEVDILEGGIDLPADLHEEGVEIDMENSGGHASNVRRESREGTVS
jgi:hypothetical protein